MLVLTVYLEMKKHVQTSGSKPSNSVMRSTVAELAAGPVHCAETTLAPRRPMRTDLESMVMMIDTDMLLRLDYVHRQ